MSNFQAIAEEESPSEEKMDTRSESFRSQDTPNSTLSSDFEDRDDPNTSSVLRLSEPETNDNMKTTTSILKKEFNDSLISKMSNLNINSPDSRPKSLGISPPKFSSTLTLTTNHPLMGIGSPEKNYPDVIPKNSNQDDKDLSLSSIEDDRPNETNGFDMYSPQRNTSKNNLYFSELFTTADSQILNDATIPPDVAKVAHQRRKIIPQLETPKKDLSTPQRIMNLKSDRNNGGSAVRQEFAQSTPKFNGALNIPEHAEIHAGVAEWCESPSHLRSMPNFDLPIEMSSNIAHAKDLESPDVISSSTQEDKSAYQALLDPYTGSVALRPRVSKSPETSRRKILLPPEDDACSLDSVSECSMESDCPDEGMETAADISHDVKRSESPNTVSTCSDSIAQYSLADELRDERSWLTVTRADGGTTVCDMKVIEPYKRVLSHGGYDSVGAAIIVFSACHLPDTARTDYRYVMDNLFLYVIWTLERLVTDDYVLVYLHGSASRRKLPTFTWLHECYKLIDKRLRKSLKHLYLVHPTFWLKSFVLITKPFVSTKFFRKLSYVRSLSELMSKVPVEPNAIPELVKNYDATR